ncbi:MAG: hypothetical protein PHS73_02170 [Candidatus Peribacteraceae bacterium]|nr:hypothetical protein [Candidatus Peribacteraceae bacterium]
MRRIRSFLFGIVLLCTPLTVSAEFPVHLYIFWGDGCPHCAAEQKALQEIVREYPQLQIHEYEVYKNSANARLLGRVVEKIGVANVGVPFTVVGDQVFVGFSTTTTARQLQERIDVCAREGCPDALAALLQGPVDMSSMSLPGASSIASAGISSSVSSITILESSHSPNTASQHFSVPVLGDIDAQSVSLPLLAVVMGILDGFNPCALWTLLFLLSLLLGMASRMRMWVLGIAFIVSSAFVYFLFMTAWLHLVLFLGFVLWVRLAIAALALTGGGYSFLKGWKQESGCLVEGSERRMRVFAQLKAAISQRSFFLALVGIIALAFAVNLVELICSAGLPAIFTQVLAINQLLPWQSYALIALYIFFFMIDDLFVFFATMVTLEMTGITTKYTRISHLVGGALMVIIGLLLLFKPEWLMFG